MLSNPADQLLNISQAAKRLGVSSITLRRWEKQGRLTSVRTAGNQRRYSLSQLQTCQQGNTHLRGERSSHLGGEIGLSSLSPRQKSFLSLALSLLITAGTVYGISQSQLIKGHFLTGDLANGQVGTPTEASEEGASLTEKSSGFVLAAQASLPNDLTFKVNIPTEFTDNVTINSSVTAPNVLYSLTAGSGVSVSSGQTPVVANTGVLSLGGSTGTLSLAAGTGISVSGLTITNSNLGSSQYIFKTISVTGQTDIAADSNTDTLTFAAGTGIALTNDATNDKLTITSSDPSVAAGWTHGTNAIYLTTSTDSVGIGTTSPSYKLHVVGTGYFSDTLTAAGAFGVTGATTLSSTLSAGATTVSSLNVSSGGITNAGSITGATGLTSSGQITFNSLGGVGILHSNVNGVLSSSAVNLTNGDITGTLPTTAGGTGLTGYTTGDIPYASGSANLKSLGIGAAGSVLIVSGGIPAWGTISGGSGGVCTNCLVSDPGTSQSILPTSPTATGLIIKQAATGSVDVFKVTDSAGTTSYLRVDYQGNVILGSGQTTSGVLTVSPTSTDPIAISPVALGAGAFTGTITSEDITQARTWTFPDQSGIVCTTAGNCSGSSSALGGSGTANYISKWQSTYSLTNSLLYDDGTYVGIGTTAPSSKLHVIGTGNITGVTTLGSTLGVTGATTLSSTLQVTGTTDLLSTLGVSGATTLSSTVGITGNTTVGGNLMVNGAGTHYFSAGNVGIGTTGPGALLDVNGTAILNGVVSLKAGGNNRFSFNNLTFSGAYTGGAWILASQGSLSQVVYGFVNDNNTGMWNPSADNLELVTGGTSRVRIDNQGNVGIGTTGPTYKLDINAGTNPLAVRSSAAAGSGVTLGEYFTSTTISQGFLWSSNDGTNALALTGLNGLQLRGGNAGGIGTLGVHINTSGNVGIGTTSPTGALSIQRSSGWASYDMQSTSATAGTDMTLYNNNKSAYAYFAQHGTSFSGTLAGVSRTNMGLLSFTGSSVGMIRVSTNNPLVFVTNELERVRIDGSGNVGIGTTAPVGKLHVLGTDALSSSYILERMSADEWGPYHYYRKARASGAIAVTGDKTGGPLFGISKGSGTYWDGASIQGIAEDVANNKVGIAFYTGTSGNILDTANEKVRITNDGNVGIGTTGPGAMLQINTNAVGTIGQIIKASASQTANLSQWQKSDGTVFGSVTGGITTNTYTGVFDFHEKGLAKVGDGGVVNIHGDDSGVYLMKTYTDSYSATVANFAYYGYANGNYALGTFGGKLFLSAGGSEAVGLTARMTIDNTNGNVGIGTAGPEYKLDVQTGDVNINSSYSLRLGGAQRVTYDYFIGPSGSAAAPAFQFGLGIATGMFRPTGAAQLGFSVSGTETMRLTTNGGMSLGSSYVTTDPGAGSMIISGNVGIGTTGPGAKLHIGESGYTPSASIIITHDEPAKYKSKMRMYTWGGQARFILETRSVNVDYDNTLVITDGKIGIGTLSPGSSLSVVGNAVIGSGYAASAGPANGLAIEGNVGIGTTNPLSKLEVNGVGSFSLGTVGAPGISFNGDLNTGLWSSTADTLNLSTGGSERVRIQSDGNVGIGTTAPAFALDILASGASVHIKNTSSSGYSQFLWSNDTTNYAGQLFLNGSAVTGYGGVNSLNFLSTAGPISFHTATSGTGLNLLTLKAGNVGIGTTGPVEELHILMNGNTAIIGQVENTNTSSAASARWVVKSDSAEGQMAAYSSTFATTIGGISVADGFAFTGSAGTPPSLFMFGARTAAPVYFITNDAIAMTLNSNGNVGIGTTGPRALLELSQGTADDNILYFSSSDVAHGMTSVVPTDVYGYMAKRDGDTGGLMITGINDAGTMTPFKLQGVIGSATPTAGVPVYIFDTWKKNGATVQALAAADTAVQFQTGGSPLVSILGSGNVGIGTTNPGLKLEVTGIRGLPATSGTTQTGIFRIRGDGSGVMDQGQISGGGSWLQATDATDLSLNYKLILNPNGGNVGIGTTGPGAALQVNGADSSITSIFKANATTPGNLTEWQSSNGTLQAKITAGGNFYTRGMGTFGTTAATGNGAFFWVLTAITNDNLANTQLNAFGATYKPLVVQGYTSQTANLTEWQNSAGTALTVIDKSGNVGIGTTGPTAKLDILAPTAGIALLGSDSSTDASNKVFRIAGRHYTNTEEPVMVMASFSSSGVNEITYGGGSSLTNTATLLSFYTAANSTTVGGTERMRIDNQGNVGIGTTGPGTKLQVDGSPAADSTLLTLNNNAAAGGVSYGALTAMAPNLTANDYIYMAFGKAASTNNRMYLSYTHVGDGSASNRAAIGFYGAGDRLSILASGNVGIGTTNPGSQLTLSANVSTAGGAVNSGLSITNSNAAGYANTIWYNDVADLGQFLMTGSNGAIAGTDILARQAVFTSVGGTGGLNFYTSAGPIYFTPGGGTTAKMVQLTNGNVGIGTTGPHTKLHVSSTTDTDILKFNGLSSALRFQSNTNSIDMVGDNAAGTGEQALYLRTYGQGGLWIKSGNVGIGTTGPNARLEVLKTTEQLRLAYSATKYTSLLTDGSGDLYITPSGGDMYLWAGSGTFAFHLYGNAVENIRLNAGGDSYINSGNVGIGTTVPLALLDVNGVGAHGLGAVGAPSFAFRTDLDTGMWSSGANTINFSTNSSEKLRIDSSGNVGIGTTNPSVKLHVNGSAIFSGTSTAGVEGELVYDTGGHYYKYYDGSNWLQIAGGSITYTGTLWTQNGTTLSYTAGYVGIGTTNPATSLEVTGAVSAGLGNVGAASFAFAGDLDTGMWSSTANTLNFSTNGAERLRITSSGNVGIGTTGPTTKLEVAGAADVRTTLSTDGSTNAIAGFRYRDITTTIANIYIGKGTAKDFTGQGDNDLVATTYTANNLILGTNSLERVRITSAGNVGIGTTGPLAKFVVQDANSSLARFINTTSSASDQGSGMIGYSNDGAALASGDRLGFFLLGGAKDASNTLVNSVGIAGFAAENWSSTAGGGDLTFETTPKTTITRTEKMRITSEGNVGIGTTGPSVPLHIYTSGSTPIKLESTGTSAFLNITSSSGASSFGNYLGNAYFQPATSKDIQFYNGNGTTVMMTVLNSGNVGIGDASPAYLLTVGSGDLFGINSSGYALLPAGAVGTPSLSFTADTNTGLYSGGTDILRFATAGSDRVTIDASGNVGIGTTAPGALLDMYKDTNGYVQAKIINPNTGSGAATSVTLGQSVATSNYGGFYYFNPTFTTNGLFMADSFNVDSAGPGGLVLLSHNANAPMIFGTGGYATANERMRITSSGNVGIGTTSPLARLGVVGADSLNTSFAGNISGLTGTGLVITNAGNVGIGTTGPVSKLNIHSATGANEMLSFTGADITNPFTGLVNTAVGGRYGFAYQANGGMFFQGYTDADKIAFNIQGMVGAASPTQTAVTIEGWKWDGATGRTAMATTENVLQILTGASPLVTFQASGNVGIGTTGPSEMLHLYKSVNANVALRFENPNAGNGTAMYFLATDGTRNVYFGQDGAGASSARASQGYIYSDTVPGVGLWAANASGLIRFYTGGGVAGNERMRIDNTGNVGIGTTSPTSLLAVGASSQFTVNSTGDITTSSTGELVIGGTGNSSIAGNVGIGTTSPLSKLHIAETNGTSAFRGIVNDEYYAGDASASFAGRKSRSATIGGQTIIQNNDTLFNFRAWGSDGTQFIEAGSIRVESDGTPGTNDMPGRITFSTTPDGGVTPVEWMRITNAGKVGIGTTSPTAQLTLYSSAGNVVRFQNSATGTGTTDGIQFGHLGDSSVNAEFWQWENGYFRIATNNTERMRISAAGGFSLGSYAAAGNDPGAGNMIISGNVGIGTTNPLSKLEVNGVGSFSLGSVSAPGVSFNGDLNTGLWSSTADTLNLSTSGSERVRIQSDGNVGIGTTGPGYKLDVLVDSTSAVNNSLRLENTGSVANRGIGTGIVFYATPTAQSAALNSGRIYSTFDASTWGSARLTLQTPTAGNAWTDVLTIKSGNVGIGTTGPSYKVEVVSDDTSALYIHPAVGLATVLPKIQLARTSSGGVLIQSGSITGAVNTLQIASDVGTIHLNPSSSVVVGSSATGGSLFNVKGNVSIGTIFRSTAAPTDGMIIEGNVGIGTTSPGQKLVVAGNIYPGGSGYTLGGNASNDRWNNVETNLVTLGGAGGTYYLSPQTLRIGYSGGLGVITTGSGNLTLGTEGTGTAVTINTTGNVGIGTTNPLSKLEVNGVGSFSLGSVSAPGVSFNGDLNTGLWSSTADTLNLSTSGSERVRIQSDGNVGIGTTNPLSKLSVAGMGSSTGTAMVIDANGDVWKDSSSIRYKDNVKPLDLSGILGKLLQLSPVSFTYKGTGAPSFGYLAEDVNSLGLTDLVAYDKEGRPDALRYDKLGIYLVEGFKGQQQKLDKLDTLETKVASLSAQLDILFDLVVNQSTLSAELINNPVEASPSATLAELGLDENITLDGNLLVSGSTNLNDLGVTGKITAGTLIIDGLESRIESLSNVLKLNPYGFAGIEMVAGKVKIDQQGNLTVQGNIKAKTVTVETGINLQDQTTNDFYCLSINNGKIEKQKGLCEEKSSSATPSAIPTELP